MALDHVILTLLSILGLISTEELVLIEVYGSVSNSITNNTCRPMSIRIRRLSIAMKADDTNNTILAYRTSRSVGSRVPLNGLLRRPRNQSAPHQVAYVLPCLRLRSTKSVLSFLAACAVLISIATNFLASKFLYTISSKRGFYSPSSGMILPSAKEWAEGRENRRKRKRLDQSNPTDTNITALYHLGYLHRPLRKAYSDIVTQVPHKIYEAHLTSFYTKLGEEGLLSSSLFTEHEPSGHDLSHYTNMGCSVFNRLYNPHNSNQTSSRETIRKFWSSHVASILEASRHAEDLAYAHKGWTQTMLKALSHNALLESLSSGNPPLKGIERLVGIIVRRLLGLMHSKTIDTNSTNKGSTLIPPPLRIAIFGGPTVTGRGCRRSRVRIPRGMMSNPSFCAFPHRLEQFLNRMLLPPMVLQRILEGENRHSSTGGDAGFRLVEVINLGEDGTYSDFSEAIVRNRMYPPMMNGQTSYNVGGYGGGPPDLVIHAYGIESYAREITGIRSFYDAVHSSYTSVLKEGCSQEDRKPPAVILYLILENDIDAFELQSKFSVMTSILGDAIDDVEEAESKLPLVEDDANLDEIGSFGMAGHIASSWVLSFDLAYAALNHCSALVSKNTDTTFLPLPHMPQTARRIDNTPNSTYCDDGISPPCIFSILTGPKGNAARPSSLLCSILPYMVENTGWQPESDMSAGFAHKTGIVGTGLGATMTLLFRAIHRPFRRFDVITLRSTSQTWSEGVVRFVLVTGGDFSHGTLNDQKEEDMERKEAAVVGTETSFEISAELIFSDVSLSLSLDEEHQRHVTYHFGLDLIDGENAGSVGTDVLLKIILVRGDKFKILGIMLCE